MGTCQHCGGSGSVTCCSGGTEIAHSYQPCPSCHGSGRRVCSHCEGTGTYPVPRKRQ